MMVLTVEGGQILKDLALRRGAVGLGRRDTAERRESGFVVFCAGYVCVAVRVLSFHCGVRGLTLVFEFGGDALTCCLSALSEESSYCTAAFPGLGCCARYSGQVCCF